MDATEIKNSLVSISRTTLYRLEASGEIVSASLGRGAARRVFLTSTVIAWLARQIETTSKTKRSKVKPRLAPVAEEVGI